MPKRSVAFGPSGFAPGTSVLDLDDSLVPDTLAPAAPTGLSASSATYRTGDGTVLAEAILSWAAVTANTDATAITDLAGYRVCWRKNGTSAWSASSALDEITTTAYFSGFVPGAVLDFRVQAFDTSGNNSAWTELLAQTLTTDTTGPVQPSTPTVNAKIGGIEVKWDGLDSAGAAQVSDFDHIDIHHSTTTGFTPSTLTRYTSIASPGGTVVIPLTDYGVPHYVKLVAYDRTRNPSPASSQASAAAIDPNDTTPPPAPASISVVSPSYYFNSDGTQFVRVDVTWSTVVASDLEGYLVSWKPSSGSAWSGESFIPAGTTSYSLINLMMGVPIDVRVRARDFVGNKSGYTTATNQGIAADTTGPVQPSLPVVTPKVGGIEVKWDGLDSTGAPQVADFDHIDIHHSTMTGFTPSALTRYSSLAATGGVVFIPLTDYGITHYVKLIAYDRARNPSAASSQASTAPISPYDTTPPATSASISVGSLAYYYNNDGAQFASVTVSWSAIADADLEGYLFSWKPNSGSTWSAETFIPVGTLSVDLRGLALGVNIDVRVRGRDFVGNKGGYVTATNQSITADSTAPGVPSRPTVTGITAGLKVVWDGLDNGGLAMAKDFDHVRVYYNTTGVNSGGTLWGEIANPAGGSIVITNLAYGTTYYVYLVSVDAARNASGASLISTPGQQILHVTGSVGGDITSIAPDLITVGSLTATYIQLSGRLTTAAGGVQSGARTDYDAGGIRGYDATSVSSITGKTFELKSSDGSLLAVKGTVGGWTLGATTLTGGSMELNNAGQIKLGTPGSSYVQIDPTNGIFAGASTQAAAKFYVTMAGAMHAESGTIAGWQINPATITGGNVTIDSGGTIKASGGTGATTLGLTAGSGFWAGATVYGSAPFQVSVAGVLTATSGAVGGWSLGPHALTGGATVLNDSGTIALGTPGSTYIQLDPTNGVFIGASTFTAAKFSVSMLGALKATSGVIGGWSIAASPDKLTGTNVVLDPAGTVTVGTGTSTVGMTQGSGLWAGATVYGTSAPFYVSVAGAVGMTNATIVGGGSLTVAGSVFLSGATGVISTSATGGQRVEMSNAEVDRINFYSGDLSENHAGYLQSAIIGSGGTRQAQTILNSPSISSSFGGVAYIRLESLSNDKTIPARVQLGASRGSGDPQQEVIVTADLLVNSGDFKISSVSVGRGYVGGVKTQPATQTVAAGSANTEVAVTGLGNMSIPVISGRRYRVTLRMPGSVTVANDVLRFNLRDGGGSAPSSGSTLIDSMGRVQYSGTAAVTPVIVGEFVAGATGTRHYGVFVARVGGTGGWTMNDGTFDTLCEFEDIGV